MYSFAAVQRNGNEGDIDGSGNAHQRANLDFPFYARLYRVSAWAK